MNPFSACLKRSFVAIGDRGACWYCCHAFETQAIRIPTSYDGESWKTYGRFCSFPCAKRYLYPSSDDDLATQMATPRHVMDTDDRTLLELSWRKATGASLTDSLRKAPSRLCLELFGGPLSIEEFRAASGDPTVTYTTQMEPEFPISFTMETAKKPTLPTPCPKRSLVKPSVIKLS